MSPSASGAGSSPSDPGLAAERTSLAWTRMGLTLVGIPSAVMAYSAGHKWIAFTAGAVAAVLGLVLMTLSLRRRRAEPGMVEAGSLRTASEQVILTAAAVVLLAVAGLDFVLL